jgi:hypothetical protein
MEATNKQFNLFTDGKGDGFDNCIVCGKKLNFSKPTFLVEIGIDGFEFGTTDETTSQGGFSIGPTCKKPFSKISIWERGN